LPGSSSRSAFARKCRPGTAGDDGAREGAHRLELGALSADGRVLGEREQCEARTADLLLLLVVRVEDVLALPARVVDEMRLEIAQRTLALSR